MLCSELWKGVLSLFNLEDAAEKTVTVTETVSETASGSSSGSVSETSSGTTSKTTSVTSSGTVSDTATSSTSSETSKSDTDSSGSETSSTESASASGKNDETGTQSRADTASVVAALKERYLGGLETAVCSLYALALRYNPFGQVPVSLPLEETSVFPLPDRFYSVTVYLVGYLLGGDTQLYDLYEKEILIIESEIPSVVGPIVEKYRG